MKKIVLLALVLAALATCLLFTACDTGCIGAHDDENKDGVCDVCGRDISETELTPKEYLQYVKPYLGKELLAAQKVDELTGMTLSTEKRSSVLGYFYNNSAESGAIKCAILNTETGTVVLTLAKEAEDAQTSSEAEIFSSNPDNPFIIVKTSDRSGEKTVYKTELYSYLGAKITEATSTNGFASTPVSYGADLWLFDGKLYLYRDGEATYIVEKGLSEIPSIDYASSKYFYRIEDNGVYIYNRQLVLSSGYVSPSNSLGTDYFVLDDGNVLIQSIIYLPSDTEEFDLFLSGYKCDVQTSVLDAKTGKTKSVTLDFYIYELSNEITNPDLKNENIKYDVLANVAKIARIENHTFSANEEIINLSNEFIIINYLAKEVPMQDGIAAPIAENRYHVLDKSGKRYLVDGKGNMIGETTGAAYDVSLGMFSNGNGKYYDMDLNLVLDVNEIEYELVENMYTDLSSPYYSPTFSVYCQGTENEEGSSYYILRRGKKIQLVIDGDPTMFYGDHFNDYYFCYDYENGDKAYRVFCNFDGDQLFKVEMTSDTYADVECVALANADCLAFEYSYKTEDGRIEKAYYISIAE